MEYYGLYLMGERLLRTLASSLPSGVILQLEAYFGFASEVGAVVISLFVLGFLIGPILWGPLSEHYGRRPITLISMPLFVGTQIGCALSKNTASILVFRLLGGIFAAAPLTNSGSVSSDLPLHVAVLLTCEQSHHVRYRTSCLSRQSYGRFYSGPLCRSDCCSSR